LQIMKLAKTEDSIDKVVQKMTDDIRMSLALSHGHLTYQN